MERIMNKENDWNHVGGDTVDPIVSVSREEEVHTINLMRTQKAHSPSQASLELIAASRGVGIQVMAEICQS